MGDRTGVWRTECFPSGTQVVSRWNQRRPHFYVYGPRVPGDEDETMRARFRTTYELCAWLNGAPELAWLRGMELSPASDEQIVDAEGRSILAMGPYVESEPGRGDWHADPAEEWRAERRYMIGRLLAGERP